LEELGPAEGTYTIEPSGEVCVLQLVCSVVL
jgi:hypothetical protein